MLGWKTPYELLYGKEPEYSRSTYVTNAGPHKGKFEPRAQKCVFIGFTLGQKAYKMYSLDTKRILVSRDVIFYEHIFPYHSDVEHETTSLPLPLAYDMSDLTYEENNETPDEPPQQEQLQNNDINIHRQSTRERRAPTWLWDYVVNSIVVKDVQEVKNLSIKAPTDYTPCTFPYNISNHFDKTYVNFLANLSTTSEPSSFEPARGSSEWEKAMHQEIRA